MNSPNTPDQGPLFDPSQQPTAPAPASESLPTPPPLPPGLFGAGPASQEPNTVDRSGLMAGGAVAGALGAEMQELPVPVVPAVPAALPEAEVMLPPDSLENLPPVNAQSAQEIRGEDAISGSTVPFTEAEHADFAKIMGPPEEHGLIPAEQDPDLEDLDWGS